ncbi:MAG: hypothetical protein AB1442_03190 [Nitrospirota bacterium]
MHDFIQRLIINPADMFMEKLAEFLPDLASSVIIFVIGFIVSFIIKVILLRFFRIVGIDKFSERHGFVEVFGKGGIREPLSIVLSRLFFWILIIGSSIIAVRALHVPAIERILESFILYLPNVFAAALILVIGSLLGNFLGRAALIAAVNAGMKLSRLIARFVKFTILLLSVTMALEQLGIGRGTVVIAFAIVFGGVVLALALAFGLGGKDIAKNYLEKKLEGEEKKDDISHL